VAWPDDVADFLALDPEQRRMVLLEGLDGSPDNERGENFILFRRDGWFPELAGFGPLPANVPVRQDQRRAAEEALRDAYAGLMADGLIRPNPRAGNTFCVLTDRGKAELAGATHPDAGRVSFARLALTGIDLHQALRDRKVAEHFRQGKFETALRDGSAFLETAIRTLGGLGGLSGVKLAAKAFANTGGPLADPNASGGDQAALQNLYQGYFGFIRNEVAHNDFRFASNKEAFQALMLLDYLTERLAQSADRLGQTLT
jgi:uncharacterized protein (TIGR02391 family)